MASELTAAQFKELNTAVDEHICAFEQFFQTMGNGPLAKPERAILKTFLLWDSIDATTRDALEKTAGK